MQEAVIVDCLRTAVGKAPRGTLRNTRPDDLAASVIRALLNKYPQVPKDEVDDVILGCAMPEAESGMNMARIAALRAGLPDIVPGVTINRFCSSGLQAIAMAADRIRAGGARDHHRRRRRIHEPDPARRQQARAQSLVRRSSARDLHEHGADRRAAAAASTASRARIRTRSRYRSHQNALRAQAEGKFDEEIVPVRSRDA